MMAMGVCNSCEMTETKVERNSSASRERVMSRTLSTPLIGWPCGERTAAAVTET